jgi:hypothetical protein
MFVKEAIFIYAPYMRVYKFDTTRPKLFLFGWLLKTGSFNLL